MKNKAIKRCKGLNKAIGFEGCGNITEIEKYGLCRECLKIWTISTKAGQKYALSKIPKAKRLVAKEKKEQSKKDKIESMSIDALIQKARIPFQKLIRIRDYRKDCICCPGKILPFNIGEYDAGHYYKAELYKWLVFHPDNCHGQRVYCNKHEHGNGSNYTEGLIIRIGWARYQKLEALKNSRINYKWDRYKLLEIEKHYKSELKKLELGEITIDQIDWSIGIIL